MSGMVLRRRKKAHRVCKKPETGVTSSINVTPLVDVVLVLLIIFMVVTPSNERQMSVQVPISATVQASEPPPRQVVVHLSAASEVTIEAESVSDEGYVEKLKAILQQRGESVVFFAAADGASYQKLVSAMDGARRAGAARLAFVTDVE